MPAAEVQAILDADPLWLAARDRRERERQRKEAEWEEAEAPLVDDLRAAGFEVRSAWDLVNTSTPYPGALPILVKHLLRPYPDRVRAGIARALAVSDARFAWETLRDLFEREPPGTDAKDGLAVALAATADDDHVDELVSMLRAARHGDSRVLLLRALERPGDPRVQAVLEELTADPALKQEAERVLARRLYSAGVSVRELPTPTPPRRRFPRVRRRRRD